MSHPAQTTGNDRDGSLPPPLGTILLRILHHAAMIAACLSLLLHVAGYFVARGYRIGSLLSLSSGDSSAPVEAAIIIEGADLADAPGAALEVDAPAVPDVVMEADLPLIPSGEGESDFAGGGLGGLGEIGDLDGVGGAGNIGGGAAGLGGGGGGASFFGIEASGNRFAYVVDVSASMDELRMSALKRELTRSIDRLLETSEFMVVKYSTESRLVGPGNGWQTASANTKREMKALIELLQPEENTLPVPAFNIVFAHRPRPDAIYFMTDGDFSDDDADAIIDLSRGHKVIVHCICLGFQGGEPRMRKIAKATRGTYTFVRTDR
jgi:hypothetical protein